MSQAYKHVVSIGFFCSTALELERYGLRDASYPLDWVICPIEPTLTLLESGFQGFVQPNRLTRDPTYGHRVRDAESGVAFYHDFDSERTIEEQVHTVREKYSRRIRRWHSAIIERTLFVRYIENSKELDYLKENVDEVLMLLRRSNPRNDLILIGNSDLPPCEELSVFRVEADKGDKVAREFVRKNWRLRLRLLGLSYPLGQRVRNYVRYLRSAHARTHALSATQRLASSVLGEDRVGMLIARIRGLESED